MTALQKIVHLFTKLQLNTKSALQGDALKHVLVSSMYAEEQSAYLNSYETGLNETSRMRLLHNWWNVNNSQSARQMLDAFLYEGLRSVFPEIYALHKTQHPCPERVLLDKVGNKKLGNVVQLFQNLKVGKQDLLALKVIHHEDDIDNYGIAAWDIAQAAFMARLCYENHWISLGELRDYLGKFYDELRKSIRSWEAYTKSYIIGSVLWGHKNNRDFPIFAHDLLYHQRSPLLQNPL